MTSCTIDPLFTCLRLAHETSEAGYNSGLMRLSHHQKRHVTALQEACASQDELRQKQASCSTWQKIGNFVGTIFIAIGIVAGVAAAAAGSIGLAVALLTACAWRIGSEVVRALNLKQKILDAIVPQEMSNRQTVCRVIDVSAKVIDLASHLILAIGTGMAGSQLLGQAKNVFELASFTATTAQNSVLAATTIVKAQAGYLEGDVLLHRATRERLERQMSTLRSDLDGYSDRLQQLAKCTRQSLDADYGAKSSILID